MNFFGNGIAGDGSNRVLRGIAMTGAVISVAALVATASLDRASEGGKSSWFASLGGSSSQKNILANLPRPSGEKSQVVGVRYGNVDYLPTASIPGKKPRFKNVLADPALGMPQ